MEFPLDPLVPLIFFVIQRWSTLDESEIDTRHACHPSKDCPLHDRYSSKGVLRFDDLINHLGMPFLNVGERCNISRSIKFKKLMMAGDYGSAMDIAKKQVEDGAHVIDINVDDGMRDSLAAMQTFVKTAVTEPKVTKVLFMLDASKFEIVLAGLKWCQGKPIVNSISLKVGEKLFKEHTTLLMKSGAAVVVMAFDEEGQAATESEKDASASAATIFVWMRLASHQRTLYLIPMC